MLLRVVQRKGYNPDEKDVPVILAIHNTVNEQGWSMLKQWEAMQGWYEIDMHSASVAFITNCLHYN